MSETKDRSNSKKALLITSFAVPFIIALTGLILGGFAPFGTKDVMTSGGNADTLMYMREFWDRVHTGQSLLYSTNTGTGYDFSAVISYYLSDPLNMLILIFPKAAMAAVLNVLYALKLGLSGMLSALFFDNKIKLLKIERHSRENERSEEISLAAEKAKAKKDKKKNKSNDFKIGSSETPGSRFGIFISRLNIIPFTLAMCYALSAYMLTDGLNVTYLTAIALFPLTLLGLDRLKNGSSPWLYCCAAVLTAYSSFYIALIEFIFLLIYVPLMDYKDFRHCLKSLALKAIADLFAVLISGAVIFSSIRSSFFSRDFSTIFPAFKAQFSYFDTFKRFLLGSLPAAFAKYANGVNVYAGVFILLLIICYILNRNISAARKIKSLSITALLTLGLFMTTPNYLLGAMHVHSENFCTFAFILIMMLLLICLDEMINFTYTASSHLLIGLAISFGMIIFSLIFCENYDGTNAFLYSMELISVYFVILILYKNSSMTKLVTKASFCAIILIEICASFISGMKMTGDNTYSYEATLNSKYEKAISHIRKDAPDAEIYIHQDLTSDSDPLTNMLLGYDYIIAGEGSQNVDSLLTLTETYEGIDIYKNDYSLKGFTAVKDPSEWEYNDSLPFEALNILGNEYLGGDDIYTTIVLSARNVNIDSAYLADENTRLISNTIRYVFNIGNIYEGDIYGKTFNTFHMGKFKKGEDASVTQITSDYALTGEADFSASFSYFNEDKYKELYEKLKGSYLTKLSDTSYTVDTGSSEGYIVIPLAGVQSWNIDSDNVSYITINGITYPAVKAGSGQEISVRYNSLPGTLLCIISVLSLIMLIITIRVSGGKKAGIKISDNRFENFLTDNRIYIYSVIISTLLYFTALILKSCVPFGNHFVLGADPYLQGIPDMVAMSKAVRSGSLTQNFNLKTALLQDGGFASYMTFLTPRNLIFLMFDPHDYLLAYTLISYLVFIIPGPAMIFYLTHRVKNPLDKSDMTVLLLTLCYTMSSYLTGFITYEDFFYVAAFFPICILVMEKLIYEKKYIMYILWMSFTMYYLNPYYAFIICEFLLLYFFISEFSGIKDFFTKGIRFALCSILPAVINAYHFLPFFQVTQSSTYSITDNSQTFTFSQALLDDFKCLEVLPNIVVVSTDTRQANTYLGILMILIIPLFMMIKRIPLSVRIRRLLLILLIYFSYGDQLLNYVFHGFHIQTKVPNRFAIFFIFFVICMAADIYINRDSLDTKRSRAALLGAGAVLMALTVINGFFDSFNTMYYKVSTLLTVIFLAGYALAVGLSFMKRPAVNVRGMLSLLLTAELVISSVYTLYNVTGKNNTYPDFDTIDRFCETYTHPELGERSEIVSSTQSDNAAKMSEFNSVSAFSSTLTMTSFDPMYYVNLTEGNAAGNHVTYGTGNPLASILLNVKYNFTSESDMEIVLPSYMKSLDSSNGYNIYENPYAISLGIFTDEDHLMSDINTKDNDSLMDYQNDISRQLVGEDLFTMIDVDKYINEDGSVKPFYTININTEYSDGITFIINFNIPDDVEGDIYFISNKAVQYIGTGDGKAPVTASVEIEVPSSARTDEQINDYIESFMDNCYFCTLNENVMQDIHDQYEDSSLKNIEITDSSISGDIKADKKGYLYISIPCFDFFTATVDGKEVTPISYMGAYGVPIETSGNHHIELTYKPTGRAPGYIVSLIGILILIGLIFILRYRAKSAQLTNEESD